MKHNELTALRKQIEREYAEKVRLEDEILEKTRSQLTMNKAATYTSKLTGKLRTNTKNLVSMRTHVLYDCKDQLSTGYNNNIYKFLVMSL